MRTLQSFLTVGVLCASFAALLAACSSSDTPPSTGAAGAGTAGAATGAAGAGTAGAASTLGGGSGTAGAGTAGAGTAGAGTAGAGTAGAPAVTGNAANGGTLYTSASLACNSCHGEDAAGGLGPNITPSATAGIGGWTEAQFLQVIRNGIVPSGMKVCASMAQYNTAAVSDQGVADIFAYVQAKPANDTVNRGFFASTDPACNTH